MQLGYDTFRTRFGSDIVAECRPPDYPSEKVAILLPGCPGYALGKYDISKKLSALGYFVIIPAYRGTWESDGSFLEFPPDEDVRIIIDQLPEGFIDLWSEGEYLIKEPEVVLIGGSFGGAASVLASRHERVKKAVAISAVVDWTDQRHTVEPLEMMNEYLPKAFGNGYRAADPHAYMKLAEGDFYNPLRQKESIDGSKLLFIHAKSDRIVHSEPARAFAKDIGAAYLEIPGDAHMGIGGLRNPKIWKRVVKHIGASEKRWFW